MAIGLKQNLELACLLSSSALQQRKPYSLLALQVLEVKCRSDGRIINKLAMVFHCHMRNQTPFAQTELQQSVCCYILLL